MSTQILKTCCPLPVRNTSSGPVGYVVQYLPVGCKIFWNPEAERCDQFYIKTNMEYPASHQYTRDFWWLLPEDVKVATDPFYRLFELAAQGRANRSAARLGRDC